MKNIFTLISNEILLNNQQIENIIYKMIPLIEIENPLSTLEYFRQQLNNKITAAENAEAIADITLKLCNSYLCPKLPLTSHMDYATLSTPLLMQPMLEIFNETIFETDKYKNELKHLMIFSYYYTKNIRSKYIHKNDEQLVKFVEESINTVSKKTQDNKDYYFDPRKINDKFHYFLKRNNNQPLLPFFFESTLVNKRWSTKFKSILDIEILLALIRSPSRKKNPFILIGNTDNNTDIHKFLQNLSFITLDKDSNASILKYFTDNNITKTQLSLYNDFFLERITNLNFINALYQLKVDLPFLPTSIILSLSNFTASPLIGTRLKIIKYTHEYFKDNNPSIDIYPYMANYLESIFLHQILCAVPITNLVFHYLMNTKFEKEPMQNSFTEDYFKKAYKDDKYFCLDGGAISPAMYKFSPKQTKNKEYMQFTHSIYKRFILNASYYSTNNFEKALDDILHNDIVNCLIHGLSVANIPHDSRNPLNIIKA
ncbi:hypothetical protein [Pectinatus frisingensis]|uniref:hypothetical protein n=1 Tax=Pectinatus frisingensis TaxID=865 RepID=UPI0018C58034|nr:hypothetical protein [Pectinatus frisingensis]